VVSFHDAGELKTKAAGLPATEGVAVAPGFDVVVTASALNEYSNEEWHYRRKNGETFFVSLNITPIKDAYNNTSNYLGIAIDISEKKKAETELVSALEKEKELNELKSRFVSMASHEFRTPLSAVLSSAYLLSKYVKEGEQPQRQKHIQRIVASVTSLTEILNDFLSVGKIEEGNIHPNFKLFDLTKLMQEVIQDVQHLLKNEQTIAYGHTGEPEVLLDPSMTKHIVTNLLSNAIKFSFESSEIKVATDKTDNRVTLSVKDSGIGIPEEDKENLFKRFFRSSNVTNIQGTGLGLHIVGKYTELMHGEIACNSKEGEGTEFTITFNTEEHADYPRN
jgi:signal transduction histidine kinase